jgi:hypothetical protein
VGHEAIPAIGTARRFLYFPVDIAYVSRGDAAELPPVALLGRGDGALVLMRFALALPPEVEVLEAYLVLDRAPNVDCDPTPIALHAARVAGVWDARSISWARQPRIEDLGAPSSRVLPASRALVRLDMRDVVRHWRRRVRDELGVAIVSEGKSATGLAFAMVPAGLGSVRDPVLRGNAEYAGSEVFGPRLELYVK